MFVGKASKQRGGVALFNLLIHDMCRILGMHEVVIASYNS